MISQQKISANTPLGANLVPGGGATFRVWAPRATEVYLDGVFGGVVRSGQTDDLLLSKDGEAKPVGCRSDLATGGNARGSGTIGTGYSQSYARGFECLHPHEWRKGRSGDYR